ncbi:MAG: response regulator transcription factor [Pseudomonadota bacterium]
MTLAIPPAPDTHIHVALVEDDPVFQDLVISAVRSAPDMVLAGVADTYAQAMRMLETRPADVLLVDLGLPDGPGAGVIRTALQRWPQCEVIVCTALGDEAHVMESIEAGAVGYLLKDTSVESMVEEIRSLKAGGSPISPLIARQILMRFRGAARPVQAPATASRVEAPVALSGRERETLEMITKGYSSDEIAAYMQVSHHTVLTYIRRIYSKLKVSSRVEMIYEARQLGLLSP